MRLSRTIAAARTALPLLLVAALGCHPFPKDPEDSLERARERGRLRVGVSEAPPWVVRDGEEARGVEPDLVRSFAESLGLAVDWRWGTVEEHVAALEAFRLDLLAGGITASNPSAKKIGATRAYYEERITVGGLPAGGSIKGARVAVPKGKPWIDPLEERGARPYEVDDLWASEVRGPRAAPAWELARHGRTPHPELRLARHRHVLAVPPGENALLVHLERYLQARRPAVEDRLRRGEDRP